MTKSKRLKPLARLADRREQEAAHALGESRQKLAGIEARLAELKTYRDQYLQGFLDMGRGGFSAVRMKDLHLFIAKLDAAIAQAEVQVSMAQRLCQQKQIAWVSTRARTKALAKVMERYRAEERKAAEHAEQQRLDEYTQRMNRSL